MHGICKHQLVGRIAKPSYYRISVHIYDGILSAAFYIGVAVRIISARSVKLCVRHLFAVCVDISYFSIIVVRRKSTIERAELIIALKLLSACGISAVFSLFINAGITAHIKSAYNVRTC